MNLLTDRGERAQNLARDYLRTAGWLDRLLGPSMRRVVRYLAGELSEEALLRESTTARASATAHHFVGLRHLERRDPDAARRHLQRSSEVGEGGGPGVFISAYVLDRLEKNADWPPTLPMRTGGPALFSETECA
ncbi:MAG: hypothetical protein HS113_21760 [Verrucomicrobiales bacterium]|nr:hypothetical protein [Verrucomicrobiales bacterium]